MSFIAKTSKVLSPHFHRRPNLLMTRTKNLSAHTVRRVLLGIVVLALAIRVLLALVLGDEIREVSGTYDQFAYDRLAQRVLAGYGFSFDTDWYPFAHANQPTAHWSFLYTLYLSGVYAGVGHHPVAARLVQVFISALGIWLVYRLGRRLFDDATGLVAAALTACYAYLILFNASLMTQSFYILAVLASLDVALGLARKSTWRRWALLGIVLGLGVLLRQSLLLFAPLLFAWIAWMGFSAARNISERRSCWRGMALAGVIIALFILPWTVRNYLVFQDFLLLNSNGGYWFYSSNHPDQGTTFDSTFKAPIPDELLNQKEPAIDRALMREGIGFILADPARVALLSVNRLKDYFWLFPTDASTPLSNWSRLLSFGLYLPFMVYGLFLSRREWRMCLPLYLYVAFDGIFCLLTWAAPRYRLPSDVIMMVFAGLAVVTLAARLRIVRLAATDAGSVANDETGA